MFNSNWFWNWWTQIKIENQGTSVKYPPINQATTTSCLRSFQVIHEYSEIPLERSDALMNMATDQVDCMGLSDSLNYSTRKCRHTFIDPWASNRHARVFCESFAVSDKSISNIQYRRRMDKTYFIIDSAIDNRFMEKVIAESGDWALNANHFAIAARNPWSLWKTFSCIIPFEIQIFQSSCNCTSSFVWYSRSLRRACFHFW